MNSRPTRDQTNIMVCQMVALRATCRRGRVGCIITKNHRIISSGYNGSLLGDCIEMCDIKVKCVHAVHAEANAISAAAREGIRLIGCTLYCTYAPCYDCAKLIIQSGISRVCYLHEYDTTPGLELLQSQGIQISKIQLDDEMENY